ncbi:hypothetical protein LOTGIDRAFT_230236 [Lottia gigantea]|uniref:Cadherin domain-containing protein n=1 Tax=Lottia gigantea TaxID=225164 RepID=V4B9A9_LOTGI|nr:hypothetical protein LOTGIDRAFT_230236 [Lottia gigantea]ESP03941.1 hypothetical protein LOTGIDRAFT_230236 [Lottia gigantea]
MWCVCILFTRPSFFPTAGTYIATLTARDRDPGEEPSVRILYFEVEDKSGNRGTLRADLIIKDVNDESPRFTNLPYRFEVYENETIGSSLFTVTTTDPDDGLGGTATYWLNDSSHLGNPFNLSGNSIILTSPLNYSINTFFQLKVNARDNMIPFNKADPVDLIVNVLDVQNMPPYFLHQPYTVSILENTTIGEKTKLKVVALDGDRGVPNDIQYSFVQGEAHNFSINSTTGEISVAGGLDADDEAVKQKGGVFRITVNASEVIPNGQINYGQAWSTTDLSITLIDVNDNEPTFTQPLYTASIAENSPKGVPLTMSNGQLIEVSDADQTSDHHSFELLMSEDNIYPDAFDTIPGTGTPIYSKSTVILKVNNTVILDYETRTNITFKIRAKELNSIHQTETTIVVQILDVNDNSPVFPDNHTTQFSVHENTEKGTFIGLMTATDKESDVTYTLDGEDDKFQIGKVTGNLTVNGCLDRELRSSYTIFVVATDIDSDSSQQRSTRQRINIDILDVNDNTPEFIDIPTRRHIPEDTKPDTELFKIGATDKDNGTNQEIEYFLTSNGNITGLDIHIDKGTVFVNQSLIGMVGLRYITVMARDKGQPPLNDTVQILIIIEDVNLHRPVFYRPSHSEYNVSANLIPEITVEEEQVIGSNILNIYANDSDSGNNGAISYKLVPDTSDDWQKFSIHRSSGVLTNDGRLDREKQEVYQISITAVDGGIPSLESTITLKIVLEDIDDNQPVFGEHIQQPHGISVQEEQTDIVVGNLSLATDLDKIPIICYYILGGELIDHFFLNKTSGVLSLVKKLDREVTSEVNLVIVARGDCSLTIQPSVSSKGDLVDGHPPEYVRNNNTMLWVRITVTDINDQPPVFSSKEITSGFLYDIDFGSFIKDLQEEVTDADIGENATPYFKLLGPITTKDIDIVDIDIVKTPPLILDINGTIKTNMLFSSDMSGAFIMKVQAYDIGNLTDEAVIEIYLISDIQRVKMVFLKTPDEVRAVKDVLIQELEKVLEYRIIVDKIATHQSSDGSPVTTKSDMFIHARYLDTDKVVPASELWRAFDFSQNINLILDKYGVVQTSPVKAEKKDETTTEDTLRITLIIVTISLGVIAVILVLFLVSLRSRYRRKLRAATTRTFGGSVKDTIPDIIPPGTNKYFAAASNPVYMKDVSLNLADDDSTSQNSLDVNEVDGKKKPEMTFEPEEQEIVMSLYDEHAQELKDSNRNTALDMVLQQYEEKLNLKSREIVVDNGEDDQYDSNLTSVQTLNKLRSPNVVITGLNVRQTFSEHCSASWVVKCGI